MWAAHHRDLWPDIDALEEPTDAGRRLDAGGFVFADPFDTILRSISASYLREAWVRVSGVLARYQLAPGDLSWGWLHPGETYIGGLEQRAAPSDFVGWTSRALKRFDLDSRFLDIDAELASGEPALRCGCSWCSYKWRIVPDDFGLGLRLIEALSTDENTDWEPAWILSRERSDTGAWMEILQAIDTRNQEALDQGIQHARATYSPLGYQILVRGFAAFLYQPGLNLALRFPHKPNE